MNKVTITLDNGRVNHIGDYNKNTNILILPKLRSIHYMRKYKGWGIDKKVLSYFSELDSKVTILDIENNRRYETKATYFLNSGIENRFYNERSQIFLSEDKFVIGNIN